LSNCCLWQVEESDIQSAIMMTHFKLYCTELRFPFLTNPANSESPFYYLMHICYLYLILILFHIMLKLL